MLPIVFILVTTLIGLTENGADFGFQKPLGPAALLILDLARYNHEISPTARTLTAVWLVEVYFDHTFQSRFPRVVLYHTKGGENM